MHKDPGVVMLLDYGQIRLRLSEIMNARGITRGALARSVNTRFEVIDKWYGGEVERIDLDVLARVCYVLNCRIDELLVYDPPAK